MIGCIYMTGAKDIKLQSGGVAWTKEEAEPGHEAGKKQKDDQGVREDPGERKDQWQQEETETEGREYAE